MKNAKQIKDYTLILRNLVLHSGLTSRDVVTLLSLSSSAYEEVLGGVEAFDRVHVWRNFDSRGQYMTFEYKDGYIVGAWAVDTDKGRVFPKTKTALKAKARRARKNVQKRRPRSSCSFLAVDQSTLEKLIAIVA